MAHFARIEDDGTGRFVVVDVNVIRNEDCDGGDFPGSEPAGQAFQASLGIEGEWVQTSYNGKFRKQYASIGGSYDPVRDIFIGVSAYPSWVLDDNGDWQAPVPMPQDGNPYMWDEQAGDWVQIPAPTTP